MYDAGIPWRINDVLIAPETTRIGIFRCTTAGESYKAQLTFVCYIPLPDYSTLVEPTIIEGNIQTDDGPDIPIADLAKWYHNKVYLLNALWRYSELTDITNISPSSSITKNLTFTSDEVIQIIRDGKFRIPIQITLGKPTLMFVELEIASISNIRTYGSTTVTFKETSFKGGDYSIKLNLSINFVSAASVLSLSNGSGQLRITATAASSDEEGQEPDLVE